MKKYFVSQKTMIVLLVVGIVVVPLELPAAIDGQGIGIFGTCVAGLVIVVSAVVLIGRRRADRRE
ncbi:hypothetical protein RCH23_003469 [Cryobacterium sp. CAN_C3]|uniref:hypothetical protein n=1 Tax=unclassified Cryobacterium TaxID=2649013 RepID=UPI0018CB2C33|nr:hypothetical protein [Cryobacterium sp. CAN_C3]MEC5156063.1 hypothetical protein [Cryobacterium sp. CAN_C3]